MTRFGRKTTFRAPRLAAGQRPACFGAPPDCGFPSKRAGRCPAAKRKVARRGLSLLEVLISAFILLFGLVGVAALLPVGKFYLERADRYDRAAAVGHAAFHEIQTRGLLDPAAWATSTNGTTCAVVIYNSKPVTSSTVLVDPIGVASKSGTQFPSGAGVAGLIRATYPQAWPKPRGSWWSPPPTPPPPPPPLPVMARPRSDYLFQSRDDLAINQPPNPDLPATQLMQTDSSGNSLVRNYDGQYSWMFMAEPRNDSNGDGKHDTGGEHFLVSVVVFDGRIANSAVTPLEYSYSVKQWPSGLGGGPVQLSGAVAALEAIDRGEWLLLSNTDGTRHSWYRVVAADAVQGGTGTRWLTLQGHDWAPGSNQPTQAGFADGVVAVYEKVMSRVK